MNEKKVSIAERILSVFLAFVMVVGLIPVTAFASAAGYDGFYTVAVQDSDGNGIEGAAVQYSISVGTETLSAEPLTDSNGVAAIDLSAYTDVISEADPATMTYTVSKDGYETAAASTPVEIKTISGDITVTLAAIVPVSQYTVTAPSVTGADILLNNQNVETLVVDENTEVSVTVNALTSYQISQVVIDGEDQSINDVSSFTKNIVVTKDTNISVVMTKVYTVTVTHTENGTVVTNPENANGTVVVNEGTEVKITATPEANYRVASVLMKYSNTEKYDETVTGENDSSYEVTLSADKDYEIEITFALNQYTVSAEPVENGSITVGTPTVDYNGSCVVTVTPDEGYAIGNVEIVGNDSATCTVTESDNGSNTYEINGITVNKQIKVEFVELETAKDGYESLFNSEDAVRVTGRTYIYKSDKEDRDYVVLFDKNDPDQPIRIYLSGRKTPLGSTKANPAIDINPNKEDQINVVEKIQLYYKAENEAGKNWHDVNGVSKENPIYIVIDTVKPETTIALKDSENQPNDNGYYNSDVELVVTAAETEDDYSGISSVDYWITDDKAGTNIVQEDNLYSRSNGEYKNEVKGNDIKTIVVDSSKCNSDYVTVHVAATDLAGNESDIETYSLKINSTPPTIKINSCEDTLVSTEAEDGFYSERKVEVIFTDRASTFDKEKATECIRVDSAEDVNGNTVDDMFSKDGKLQGVKIEWSDSPENSDEHIATITFDKDAKYEWTIGTYTNKADLSNDGVFFNEDSEELKALQESELLYAFAIDNEAPAANIGFDNDNIWNRLIEKITFGIWKNNSISVTATAADNISAETDIKITYYKSKDGIQVEADSNLDELEKTKAIVEQLEKLNADGEFKEEKYTVSEDEKFVVYARIADQAGNVNYVSTDGLVVDTKKPVATVEASAKANTNNLYNSNVNVVIQSEEPVENGIYSGLEKITYKISASDLDAVEEGTLFDLTAETPVTAGAVFDESEDIAVNGAAKSWNGTITVDANKFNSNNVVVEVTVVDRAGNITRERLNLSIDSTKPTINISYSNNSAANNTYFKADRTAEIVVTERNFNPDAVKINITNTDGVIPAIGTWKKTEGTGNKDNTQWTTTVTYSADGDYTFDIAYTDQADNVCPGAQYGNSAAPTAFTIDKTNPTISVSYDNNSAQNGKYFKSARTATITIKEHNFDVNAVKFTQSASLNGSGISIPSASWRHSGDVHTATISYSADGDYKFDVTMSDMAGNESGAANYGNSVAAKDFTVDKTITQPVIGGVENGKAYKNDVIPTINFNDVNFASYEVKLLRTRMGEKNVDVTSKFIKGLNVGTQSGTGTFDTFNKIAENDGIYTLSVKINDKAGNSEESTVTFTVNRFGSVYAYSDYLISLLKDGGAYVQSVTDDLVITEYNPDRLVGNSLNIEITCDGKPLEKVIYDVNPEINNQVSVGSSGWYEYKYTISKANFAAEGVYKISVSSKDATGNTPENSNYDDMNIQFRVDNTKPEITSIVGLEKNIINAQEVVVKYTVFDAIGLKSIRVLVDGKQVGDTITDFGDDINNYNGSFVLGESSSAQKIQILVEDLSGHVTDTSADGFQEECAYTFNDAVTVSTNMFVRWFANKPLFWGTIGAVVVLAGGLWFLIAAKRKKKEDK